MSFFWNKCKNVLPEESGRVASRPFGAAYYRVLVAVEDEEHCVHTYEAVRIRRIKTGVYSTDWSMKKGDENWHWEYVGPPGTVLAWTWLPDENDAAWIRDKMPEETAGMKTSKVFGIEGIAVLALTRVAAYQAAGPEAHTKCRYRLCRGGQVSDWAWSCPDGVMAWMPLPQFEA